LRGQQYAWNIDKATPTHGFPLA